MSRSGGWMIAAVAAACALAGPSAASAGTVNIGSNLQNTYNFAAGFCLGPCVGLQQTQTTAAGKLELASPVNGTITGWSVRSGQIGSSYILRVLRPAGGLSYAYARTSAAGTPVPDTMDVVRDYPTSLPIKQGDRIGLQPPAGIGLPMHTGAPLTAADVVAYHAAGGADGGTFPFDTTNGSSREVLLRATITFCRVPAVKGKLLKRARGMLAAAGCQAKVKRRFLEPSKKNKQKRGKVLKQQPIAGTTQAPSIPVALVVGKLGD